MRVDGRIISELGTRIDPEARIELLPGAVEHQDRQVTILLNKPIGFVSAQPEDGHRAAVELFTAQNQWERDPDRRPWNRNMYVGMAPAGRLDIDSQGLLILTQDGRIARRIIDKTSPVEKEYLVRVQGGLDDRGLALLRHGLSLDDQPLKPAHVEWINSDQLRFRPHRGQEAPDPPHVRAGRPARRRPQARPHRQHRPRPPARGPVAASRTPREILTAKLPPGRLRLRRRYCRNRTARV
ncbi:MAG: pseudouridine synthase [Kiritimatiellia bacterium]